MASRLLQHVPELEPGHVAGTANVRRVEMPTVEMALGLQRSAGNRAVAALVGQHASGAGRRPVDDLVGSVAASRRPPASAAGASAVESTRSAAASVQRAPCTDCPDAVAPPSEGDDLREAPVAG